MIAYAQSLAGMTLAYVLAMSGHVVAAVIVAHTAGVLLAVLSANSWGPRL